MANYKIFKQLISVGDIVGVEKLINQNPEFIQDDSGIVSALKNRRMNILSLLYRKGQRLRVYQIRNAIQNSRKPVEDYLFFEDFFCREFNLVQEQQEVVDLDWTFSTLCQCALRLNDITSLTRLFQIRGEVDYQKIVDVYLDWVNSRGKRSDPKVIENLRELSYKILLDQKKKIAIFVSGAGTNARNIIQKLPDVEIEVYTDNPKSGVFKICDEYRIPCNLIFNQELGDLKLDVDLVVLAGYLKKIPDEFLANHKVINIHPSLLPKFGGKGMWGERVHQAVLDAGEKQSGITIHWVNGEYDSGEIIKQVTCEVAPNETIQTLVHKIRKLEFDNYPKVIQQILD